MQHLVTVLALLGAANAFPGGQRDAYGYSNSNTTKIVETPQSSTAINTAATGSTSTCLESSSTASSSSSSIRLPHSYPTGGAPWHHQPGTSVPSRPHPYPTGGSHNQLSASATVITTPGTAYITETTTMPITKTITNHIPCSTEVTTNGQSWWSTYLTISYYTTSYMTTSTIVAPQPTTKSASWHAGVPAPHPHSAPWYDQCPPHSTITETVTRYISLPSPRPEVPSQPLTTKTLTLTLDQHHVTTITVSFPVSSSATTAITKDHVRPPYPTKSSSMIEGQPYPTGSYPAGTGILTHATASGTKSIASAYTPSSSSTAWTNSHVRPGHY